MSFEFDAQGYWPTLSSVEFESQPRNVRFTPKADIGTQPRNVRFVPKADIAQRYSILLSTVMLRRAAGLAQNVGDREVRCVTRSETGRPAAPDGHGTARDGSEL